MNIPCVEEYQKLELKSMPHVSKMLFPRMPYSKPLSEEELQVWLNSEDGGRFSHPASKENIGSYRLRRVWLARRSFVAMEEIHKMVFHHTKGLSGDAQEYIFSKFQDYLWRHGGWLNLGQDAGYDYMEEMGSMTFAQASKGFLSGHILKHCVENMCNAEAACGYISDNYDRFAKVSDVKQRSNNQIDPTLDEFENTIKAIGSFPVTFLPVKSKYSSSYLWQYVWNEMKSVSYAWAAAVEIFGDASAFTHRMISSARPFDFDEAKTLPNAGYAAFVSRARHYFSLATLSRRSPKRKLPPLIKNYPRFLFD